MAEKSRTLDSKIQELLGRLEVDLVGVATLKDVSGTPLEEQSQKLLPEVQSIVVLAMEIYPEFLDLTTPQKTMGEANLNDLYSTHTEYLNGRMNRAAYEIANAAHAAGYKALPLPSKNSPSDRRTMQGAISYKHAAAAAGLGKTGMSSLLLTPEYGPRVRIALVLTEARLQSTTNDEPRVCRYCNACVLKCPAKALGFPKNGEAYVINQFACNTYEQAAGGCSECMRVCPIANPRYD